MEKFSLNFAAKACGGEIVQGSGETEVLNVCTDSRAVKKGDLFFAIKGEKFDGHDFVAEAAKKKVAAVVIEKSRVAGLKPLVGDCPVLAVDDVRAALGKLAAMYRKEFSLPVICVAGSNGKTTTKELIGSVLRQKFPTLWSEASFNNDIGVPMTLLRLGKKHQAAVLEAGTNHPGELAPLVRMIAPKFGVITSIGREHLEFFGDLAGVAQEEGSLAELLPVDGVLFLNGDDAWSEKIAGRTKARVVRVGTDEKHDWHAKKIKLDKSGVTFQVECGAGSGTGVPPVQLPGAEDRNTTGKMPVPLQKIAGEYRVNLLGRHQVTNSLLALAIGVELGLTRKEILDGLAECQPQKMRMNFWEANGVRVLDDCYNANADSMRAALETLSGLPLQGRRVAILGDMAELGAQTEAAHAEIGKFCAELKIGQLFAVGKNAAVTAKAARDAGLARVVEFPEVESAVKAVKNFLKSGDVVLLKASRSTRLERIAETLKSGKN